ncbi:MAG: sensor histidine kinase [Lachnospiraceae bacterium]|nr:sensor histidine kinase [Lachnospiraceae bacterium]
MGLFNFLFGRLLDRRIAAYQNDLIKRHCDEVENIYKTMRGWRHDYHNHIQAMKALTFRARNQEADNPFLEQLDEYLNSLNQDLTSVDTVIKTGNIMVDAILNSKLSLIRSNKITVNAKAAVPSSLPVSEVDLCTMIGNLLDNAMEACLRQENADERFIRVFIGVLKGQLYISVSNSTGNTIKKQGKTFLSSKDSPSHGFGLMRVDRIAEKYSGYVNRQHEEGIFATEIMLPL